MASKVKFIDTSSMALPPEPRANSLAAAFGTKLFCHETLRALLGYLLLALVLRGATIGFPVIHIDEQFYLLVGDRMLHGTLPFVDVWDRKPIGLFLIYAAIRLLGGVGIVQYQLMALGFAVGTSVLIYRISRQIAPREGAWWAGVAYQLYLSSFYCFGGQAPVFYNLIMATAGALMMRVWIRGETGRVFVPGCAVMAVVGMAMQIKYTVVFEGMAFGLTLIWIAHRAGWHRGRIAAASLVWACIALVPTAAAWGAYAAIGHGQDFVQANFLSIFGRHEDFLGSLWRLTKETLALLGVGFAIRHAHRLIPQGSRRSAAHGFALVWAASAVLGFLLFGTWYDHYVAPLLVPLMICAAPSLGRPAPLRWITRWVIGFGVAAAAVVTIYNVRHHGTTDQVYAAADAIHEARTSAAPGNPCIYINEGDPVLYLLSGSCLTTRYTFPNHLNSMSESQALGVDPLAEVNRIMATHPAAVVMTKTPSYLPANMITRNAIFAALARDYELFATREVGWRTLLIYRLKPGK